MNVTEVTAVIDRYEEDKAVLLLRLKKREFEDEFEDEFPVVWPRECLPEAAKIKEGSVLKITLEFRQDLTDEAHSEAEKMLEELLKRQNDS